MTIGLDWALVAALGAALTAEGAVLHDGAEVKGRIVALKDGSLEIEGLIAWCRRKRFVTAQWGRKRK